MKTMNLSVAGMACVLLGACATVPEVPPLPKPVVPQQFVSAAPQAHVAAALDPEWWRTLQDPALNALVSQALDQNPGLAEAAARIDAARAQTGLAQADSALQVSVQAQAGRSKSSTRQASPYAISVPDGSNSALQNVAVQRKPYATSYLVPLQASYALDVWGRLSATGQAAVAQERVSAEDYAVARLSLLSNLVSTYLQLRMQQGQRDLLREELRLREGLLSNAQARVEAGLEDVGTLGPAQMNAENSRRALADMTRAVALDVHALEVLCGLQPGTLAALQDTAQALPALPATPVALPSTVLRQRPDVRRDEASLQAAHLQTRAARAAYFPQFSLTSSVGRASDSLSELLQPGSMLWSLATQITYPVLDGGRVRAGYAQAAAQLEEAAQHYQGTVIEALREVEDALVSLDSLRTQQGLAGQGDRAAERVTQRQQQRRDIGLATQDDYAIARLSELQQRNDTLQVQGRALNAYVSLRVALGG